MDRNSIIWGAGLLALAVALGAFGAHGLKAVLSPTALANWNTGVHYQFIHALGILIIAPLSGYLPVVAIRRIRTLFIGGIALFSGSLYILSTRELTQLDGISTLVGPVTPLGGLLFVAGWIWLLITAWRSKS